MSSNDEIDEIDEIDGIDFIDQGLGVYYEKLGRKDYFNNERVGKFKVFAEESGFEQEDVDEELAQPYDDCTMLEFDCDDDDNNNFPLEEPISDEDERNKEIHRILNDISKYGAAKQAPSTMELKIDICYKLSSDEFKDFTARYIQQLSTLDKAKKKDSDLKHYFAVGLKQEYPFMMYMVDCFTKAKAEYFIQNKKDGLSVLNWANKNKFISCLKKKSLKKADQLQSAITTYGTRVMNRLQFEPTYKVNDSIKQISEYITSVPTFIQNLIADDKSTATPPFQVDLLIAVKDVKAQFDEQNESDSDEYDDEEEQEEKHFTHNARKYIGNVHDEFNKLKIYYEMEQKQQSGQLITRRLGEQYKTFRTVLDGEKSDNNTKSKHYNAETYPRHRRFSIFVDRRENKTTITENEKDSESKPMPSIPKNEHDPITIFEPPNECNKMPHNSVPEIGFEFVKQCLLPNSKDNITANDSVGGELMTFMFNVEAKDEIRCYIVWNSQTMRFHGDYVSTILPSLFEETEENKTFAGSKEAKQFEDKFDSVVNDRKFNMFYQALKNFA